MTLALFDLDHTLLDGDSDVLWCEFLMDRGLLDRATFAPRNAAIEAGYRAGSIGVLEFCEFFIGLLAGRTPRDWAPLRDAWFDTFIRPRFLARGLQAIAAHREAGDTLVLTTATNRFLSEPSATALGFPHLIATEAAFDAHGRFTGRVAGTPNMRDGKVTRLADWLHAQERELGREICVFYSDSINDLPLLSAVRHPVAVDPDPRLAAHARAAGWERVSWRG